MVFGEISLEVYIHLRLFPEMCYSDLQERWPGWEGNLSLPSSFIPESPCDGYHLDWWSPCIDAGNPHAMYRDRDGTRADMGSNYYAGWISPPVGLVAGMDADVLRLSWPRLPSALYYNGYYASEADGRPWYLLTSTSDTTTRDPIGNTDKRFCHVRAVFE